MKYIRNQFVRTGSIMWWIFILIIGSAALWWGITVLQWSWLGILPILIGATILYRLIVATANRDKLRRIVIHEFEINPESSINDILIRTGISKRDVRAILLDLKSSGHFIGHYSTKNGQIQYISSHSELNGLEEGVKYCPSCGTPISDESVQYCAYCGVKI
ncbi:MAG: zinc ribbon domain-containing protein [Candidatus Heimdallarchaeota archaeon]